MNCVIILHTGGGHFIFIFSAKQDLLALQQRFLLRCFVCFIQLRCLRVYFFGALLRSGPSFFLFVPLELRS